MVSSLALNDSSNNYRWFEKVGGLIEEALRWCSDSLGHTADFSKLPRKLQQVGFSSLKHRAEVFRQTRHSSHKPGVPHTLPQLPIFGDTGSGPKQRAGREAGGRTPAPSPRVLQAEQSLRSLLLLKISACTHRKTVWQTESKGQARCPGQSAG